jgi:hypothetical protein
MKPLFRTLIAAALSAVILPADAAGPYKLGSVVQGTNDATDAKTICGTYTLAPITPTDDIQNLIVALDGKPGAATVVVKVNGAVAGTPPVPSTTGVPLGSAVANVTIEVTCPTGQDSVVGLQATTGSDDVGIFVKTTGGATVDAIAMDGSQTSAVASGAGIAVLAVPRGTYSLRACLADACVWSGNVDSGNAKAVKLSPGSGAVAKLLVRSRPVISDVATSSVGQTIISGTGFGTGPGFVNVVRPDGSVSKITPKNTSAGKNWTDSAIKISTPSTNDDGSYDGVCLQVFSKYGGFAANCSPLN